MSGTWDLKQVLSRLHSDIEQRLEAVRATMGHTVAKGDASEGVWLELFNKYLPKRYQAIRAYVVDSKGTFSQKIDIVIREMQYSPFIFNYEHQLVVPAESVYAVFEAKQSIDAEEIEYAKTKAASVRALHRTSLPIPTASGIVPARPLWPITAGILTFESEWSPALGDPLKNALATDDPLQQLDLGCVAARGMFSRNDDGTYTVTDGGKPATAFLFNLIARLQAKATVPMIDVAAYADWLAD